MICLSRVALFGMQYTDATMAVVCSHCGEELMGAVNRCWRCGKALAAHSGPQDIPPVRRSPISAPTDAPVEAAVLPDVPVVPGRETRRGSPFVANTTTLRVAGPIPQPAAPEPARPSAPRTFESQTAAQVAAAASFVLGVIALGLSSKVPVAAVCVAIVVLGFGIWGLYGRRYRLATLGLIVGCIALAWGGFGTVVQIYEMLYGVHPFATSPPMPPVVPTP
jgi:hypothetical protein